MNPVLDFRYRYFRHIIILSGALLMLSCSQESSKEIPELKQASEYFPKEKTQVLVVGTFHFDYPGLDYNITSDENKIDVLKEPKKTEVTELVEYIKKFRPNKIAIEAFPGWEATSKLRKYSTGDYRDKRDERYQLGMRIAFELELDTLYSIDSDNLSEDLEKIDSAYIENLFQDFDFENTDPYNQLMTDWYKEEDKLASETNLLDLFKLINSREWQQYGYGAYLVGDFKLENNRGADILSIWWYNRNLRIFRKLQEITHNKNDRILVIFGNGHVSILRQLLESSPEYDFVEFDSL